jgi:hypothetical protein
MMVYRFYGDGKMGGTINDRGRETANPIPLPVNHAAIKWGPNQRPGAIFLSWKLNSSLQEQARLFSGQPK